jgi:hypothetical protein
VSIVAPLGLMALTLISAYLLWSLLLRAEQLYTRVEGHNQAAADIAGVAFLGIAAVIVGGAAAALLLEIHRLVSTLLS